MRNTNGLLRTGTINVDEQLERLLTLKPACARSSLLAHRTGGDEMRQSEESSDETVEISDTL